MWKWTDGNDVQLVILDMNSLSADYIEYDYRKELPDLKILKAEKKAWGSKTEYDTVRECIRYSDVSSLLNFILQEYEIESYSIIAMSNSNSFLKQMMQNHIGTIFVGALKEDVFKYTPDFTSGNFTKLANILKEKNKGYYAEVLTSTESTEKRSLIRSKKVITLSNGDERQMELLLGGRYYPKWREFYIDDPLSFSIRNFKNNYVPVIDKYFDDVICHVNKKNKIDILAYSPPKPKDFEEGKFNRFSSLKLPLAYKKGIQIENILECTKDFSQKGNDLYNRKEVVKGAYDVLVDIKDKHVVILDDVYSTGSTIEEIARTLYETGAKQVTAILIAVSQMIQSTSQIYKHPKCKNCESDLKLKINHTNNELFFGCEFYMTEGKHTTLSCLQGLEEIKQINKIEQIDIEDLDDIY